MGEHNRNMYRKLLILLLGTFVLALAQASAAITFVQNATVYTGTTATLNFPSANTAGNLIILVASGGQSNGNPMPMPTISDYQGNVYTNITFTHAGTSNLYIWYAKNIKGGANNVTVALTNWDLGFNIQEFSGVDTTSPFLDNVSGCNPSGTYYNTSVITINNAPALLFAAANEERIAGAFSAGANFTMLSKQDGHIDMSEYRVVNSNGNYIANATGPDPLASYGCLTAAAFKAANADTIYPIFSNYWDDNATLVNSGIAHFNVTVDNTNGTVWLSLGNTNYTAVNVTSNVYNVSFTLTSGVYTYNWSALGNGTNKNLNISATRGYTVNSTGQCVYTSGDWTISDGSICNVTSSTVVFPNKIWLLNGKIRVLSGGSLKAKACWVASGMGIWKDVLAGGLYCGA